MTNPFYSPSQTYVTCIAVIICLHFACPFQVYIHTVCIAGHITELVNFYTKVFMFLRYLLFKNDSLSLSEEHNNFIHS